MKERIQHMQQLGAQTSKYERHRSFHWCRRPNGFSDLPVWRTVATKLGMPAYQVQAFGHRLEELGNSAPNFGEIRGSVARFNAEEFGTSLGMPADEAALIFMTLEEVGWIAFDHIADFYARNPDKEDETAGERMKRKRTRDRLRRQLSKLALQGRLEETHRRTIEASLMGISDAELMNLEGKLLRYEATLNVAALDLESFEKKLSTAGTVTRNSRPLRRNDVTVTPEQITNLSREAVDNSGDADAARGAGPAAAGAEPLEPVSSDATAWMDSDGRELIVLRLECTTQRAEQFIERWRRDLQDDAALKEIIQGAVSNFHSGARFHVVVADGVQRFIRERAQGGQVALPLNPVNVLKRSGRG